ncbi:uncharacterized protein I303_108325 [Kwoniella dejecticola CBS 10117]|uniref:Aminotransferase class I/classII large domain-containing protein n=1 Tax=Kwoniella dejecticola CBS 10117 TaxID=1296121 RepID=A0A1A5ZXP8_9TREE|nr:uncharacterized protein I303_07348 [Kwoniella dejecticola CBS 10117]OBR82586.1 hypothetical protein I303_07348 [Kwoniella dejecticola CBS 10117]
MRRGRWSPAVNDDYVRDIKYPAQAQLVLAHIPPDVDPLSIDVIPFLQERLESSAKEGVHVKVVILCNPHNPIPRCHPRETIEGYISLARQYDVHLIVDEVFAYSVFPTKDNPTSQEFISVLSLPSARQLDVVDRIHVLGGPTKDLGCSGLKAALLVRENTKLREHVKTSMMATPISGVTDALLSELLGDEARLSKLLEKSKRWLSRNMDLCARWARFHGLPYIGANAGVYFILDLSPIALKFEQKLDDKGIKFLMERMIKQGVHINPTTLDADPLPCSFRFIFTQKWDTLKLALRRLEAAFELDACEVEDHNEDQE